MRRGPGLFLAVLFIVFVSHGCAERAGDHVHIFLPAKGLNIWSYSPIGSTVIDGTRSGEQGFIELSVLSGNATIVLQNGSTIKVSDQVMVNNVLVPAGTLNVLVGRNGEVELNSYIRTFE